MKSILIVIFALSFFSCQETSRDLGKVPLAELEKVGFESMMDCLTPGLSHDDYIVSVMPPTSDTLIVFTPKSR